MISQLQQGLRSLKCYHMANVLEEVVQISKENDLSYLDCLNRLVEYELKNRKLNRIKIQFRRAGLPYEKLLEEFDFKYQTSISKRQVNGWLDFSWIDNRENKLFLGPSGVGKTHLAIGLSREALQKGYKVRYFSMCDFVEEMIIKEASSSSKGWLKELLRNDLIVLDEIGYLPIDPWYTHLFFQFINECYEYRSVLITSNKMPAQWGSYFGDESVAMAILDRLMHHSEIVILNGDSYRLKDKLDTLKASEKFSDGAFPLRSKAPSENFN